MEKERMLGRARASVSTEGTRRVTEVDTVERSLKIPPDPEVSAKPTRRKFSAAYKVRILQKLDSCASKGEKSALLRREGLYSHTVSRWRKLWKEGKLSPASKRESRINSKEAGYRKRLMELELENERLQKKLQQANQIIEFQKKFRRYCRSRWRTTERVDEEGEGRFFDNRGDPGLPGFENSPFQLLLPPPEMRFKRRWEPPGTASALLGIVGLGTESGFGSPAFGRVCGQGAAPGLRNAAGPGDLSLFGANNVSHLE